LTKILIKIAAVLTLLVAFNGIYTHCSMRDYQFHHALERLQIESIQNCEILYFSASSNFSQQYTVEESDPRKLSQFLQDFYPSLQVDAVNKPASHAGTHLKLMEIIEEGSEVQTIVATMNLRSFGPDWVHSNLETALNQSEVMYNHRPALLNRLLVSLKAYDDKTEEERLEDKLSDWGSLPLPYDPPMHNVNAWCAVEKWGDWRNPKRQLADQYIKQFALVLTEDHPRVHDFDQMVELANERGWNLVFNILPENLEVADSLVGAPLTDLMKQNRDWLKERYEARGAIVVDNLELLGDAHFTDKNFPTEHFDDTGRKKIAHQLASSMQTIHASAYQTPRWK